MLSMLISFLALLTTCAMLKANMNFSSGKFEDCSINIFLCTYSLVSRKILPFVLWVRESIIFTHPKVLASQRLAFLKVFTLPKAPWQTNVREFLD